MSISVLLLNFVFLRSSVERHTDCPYYNEECKVIERVPAVRVDRAEYHKAAGKAGKRGDDESFNYAKVLTLSHNVDKDRHAGDIEGYYRELVVFKREKLW